MMDISTAAVLEAVLKQPYSDVRITRGTRWLYWDEQLQRWKVRDLERKWHFSRVLVETVDLKLALDFLSGED